jgi:protein TonB
MPIYPQEFRDTLKEGEVVLEIVVKSDGSVGRMETISSDDEAFTKAALEAVATWKFKPAEKNGEAVDVRVRVPIPFKITSLVFNPKELTQAPKPISQPAPAYPQKLRKAGIEGVVLLMFNVRSDGTTAKITVIKSDHPGFNEPAIEAVRKWRFKPGMKNGRAVTARVRIPIPFRIRIR